MRAQLAVIRFIGNRPGEGGEIDNSLPEGGGPVDPGFGRPGWHPIDPGFGVGGGPVDPGFGVGLPPVIDNGLPENGPPTYPIDPGFGVPSRPGFLPKPPFVGVWPPPHPVYPSLPIYPTDGEIDNSLPLPPGSVWPPLPPDVSGGKILAFAWLVGIGYRWIVIDPSLKPGFPLPKPPNRPGNELPDTPQPKR